jgi:hypothetical protein
LKPHKYFKEPNEADYAYDEEAVQKQIAAILKEVEALLELLPTPAAQAAWLANTSAMMAQASGLKKEAFLELVGSYWKAAEELAVRALVDDAMQN